MKPRESRPADVPPREDLAELLAEWITAMPIVLLGRALYEGFVEPSLRGESLMPVRQA